MCLAEDSRAVIMFRVCLPPGRDVCMLVLDMFIGISSALIQRR